MKNIVHNYSEAEIKVRLLPFKPALIFKLLPFTSFFRDLVFKHIFSRLVSGNVFISAFQKVFLMID